MKKIKLLIEWCFYLEQYFNEGEKIMTLQTIIKKIELTQLPS